MEVSSTPCVRSASRAPAGSPDRGGAPDRASSARGPLGRGPSRRAPRRTTPPGPSDSARGPRQTPRALPSGGRGAGGAPFASIDDIPTVGRDAECRIAGREGVLRPAQVFVQIRAKQAGFGVRRLHLVKDPPSIGSPAEVPQLPREFEAALRGAEFDGLPERALRVSVAA